MNRKFLLHLIIILKQEEYYQKDWFYYLIIYHICYLNLILFSYNQDWHLMFVDIIVDYNQFFITIVRPLNFIMQLTLYNVITTANSLTISAVAKFIIQYNFYLKHH